MSEYDYEDEEDKKTQASWGDENHSIKEKEPGRLLLRWHNAYKFL